jgi:Fic family protein
MIVYIHERANWPRLHWDRSGLANELAAVRHRQGRLIGRMEALGFRLREEAVLNTLTQDVLKSSEIEGERAASTGRFLLLEDAKGSAPRANEHLR